MDPGTEGWLYLKPSRWHWSHHWWPIWRGLSELTVLFLHIIPSLTSVYKSSCPTGSRGGGMGESAFGQMFTHPCPQFLTSEIEPTFLSTNPACWLALKRQAARPPPSFGNTTKAEYFWLFLIAPYNYSHLKAYSKALIHNICPHESTW